MAWKQRRAGHRLPRPRQPRQPDPAPRRDREHQPLRRAAAAAVRVVQPRLHQPRAYGARPRARSTRDAAARSCASAVRFLDNVIDVNRYPLPQIAEMTPAPTARSAWASWASPTCCSSWACRTTPRRRAESAGEVMSFIQDEAPRRVGRARRGARRLPQLRGQRLRPRRGERVRNATTTTIAPTGTISIIAGCSSGIEPLFASRYVRATSSTTQSWSRSTRSSRRSRAARGFYSDELMEKIAEKGTRARHGRSARRRAGGLRDRARHHARVARQDAGGVPEVHRQRRVQDRQLPQRGRRRRGREGLPAGLRDGLQGRHDLPRRQPRGAGAQHRQTVKKEDPGAGIAATRPRGRSCSPARRSAWTPAAATSTSPSTRTSTACSRSSPTWARPAAAPRPRPRRSAGSSRWPSRRALGAGDRQAAQGHPLPRAVRHGTERDAELRRRDRQGDGAALRHRGRRRRGRRPAAAAVAGRGRPGRLPRLRRLIEHEGGCAVCRRAASPSAADRLRRSATTHAPRRGKAGRACGATHHACTTLVGEWVA